MNDTLIDITNNNHILISNKIMLKKFYLENYSDFAEIIKNSPSQGSIVELGCGATFLKEIIPTAVTTDVFQHQFCDLVVDATKMPIPDSSVKAFFMMNVFHHVPDVDSFLREVSRCLEKDGILYIADQHVGIFSYFILKYFHNEYFDHKIKNYTFKSVDPLNSANGALTWMVFKRDKLIFEKTHNNLEILEYGPRYPLKYWLLGGLKRWCLIRSGFVYSAVGLLEKLLLLISPNFGSFVRVIIKKR